MPYDYPQASQNVQARISQLGFTPDHLRLMGSFIVAYGLFETGLEAALWALAETDVAGTRPFTEKLSVKDQFSRLGTGSARLTEKCNAVVKVASQAAEDLNEYRNSLVHGYVLSFGPGSTPSFMKNPAWHNEKRSKPVGDAYIGEPVQDLVLIAAWTLATLVQLLPKAPSDSDAQLRIEALEADVRRAKSYAGEARHLRSLMNHEKY